MTRRQNKPAELKVILYRLFLSIIQIKFEQLSIVEIIVLFAKLIQCHETYGASESDDSSDDRII